LFGDDKSDVELNPASAAKPRLCLSEARL
jgi:hypothetical protein